MEKRSAMPASPEPAFIELAPVLRARGTVTLPGSKSISNRALLLAALADGETSIRGLLHSDDTERMTEALQQLGIRLDQAPDQLRAVGCGGEIPVKETELFLGNAGTALRPLAAVLAMAGGHYKLSGVARMHQRPIGDLVEALRELGADIRYLGEPGFPPLEIRPAVIHADDTIKVGGSVSSQFLTALLMALPLARVHTTTIEVDGELISKPYVEITLNLMRRFGVKVEREDWIKFHVAGAQRYTSPGNFTVEGDASSASYFLAAGAVGGPVRVEGVGEDSIQGDVRFIDALKTMGASIRAGGNWIEASAPQTGRLLAFDGDCNAIPDAAMTLAVLALFAEGRTHLRNIASWRVKETDRISAMATELRKLGAKVEEGAGDIAITPPTGQHLTPGAAIDTYDDHRMAMCFSLAALAGVSVRINDPDCVSKTFPDYFERFASICQRERD